MSGIFKSVTKLFSSVGRIVKKIAPKLVMAAAMYFGGSYLGSGGGAGGFSKLSSFIKNIFGSTKSSGPSASAAAYAEANYSGNKNNYSLSSSVAGASSAVKAVSAGSDMESSQQIAMESAQMYSRTLSNTGSVADAIISSESISDNHVAAMSGIDDRLFEVNQFSMASTDGSPDDFANMFGTPVKDAKDNIAPPASTEVTSLDQGQNEYIQDNQGSVGLDTSLLGAQSSNALNFASLLENQMLATAATAADNAQRDTDYLDFLKSNMAQNRQLQWAGLLTQSLGALLPTAEEKELKYKRNFKEEGSGGPTGVTIKPDYGVFGRDKGIIT